MQNSRNLNHVSGDTHSSTAHSSTTHSSTERVGALLQTTLKIPSRSPFFIGAFITMSAEQQKAITIEQLCVGMFVTKLDISWLDSPFLSHTRLIKQTSDIESLKAAGVKKVVIDLSRSTVTVTEPGDPVETQQKRAPVAAAAPVPVPLVAHTQTETRQTHHVEREMAAAVQLRGKIRKVVENLQRTFETGAPVPVAELVHLVDSTLESLARNDQALMSLVHLSRKAQKIADHVFGVFCLVLNLALVRKVPDDEREQLGLAALLHEAGWTQLPLNLLGKRTRYTKAEESLVRKHTLLGDQILARSELPKLTQRLVAEHHELLDGSGYPRGLRGSDLHPLSHLLSVVDAYEERVRQLTDEPGVIPTNALRSLYRDAERGAFSPEVVASFIGLLGIYPPTAMVLLNTGEKAVVRRHHADAPLLPEVVVVVDGAGTLCHPPLELDLRHQVGEPRRTIESAVDLHSPGNENLRRLPLLEDLFSA